MAKDIEIDKLLDKYVSNYNLDVLGFRESGQQTLKKALLEYIQREVVKAQVKILRGLPDVRLGGDSAQWFEDYLWKEIEKLEAALKNGGNHG